MSDSSTIVTEPLANGLTVLVQPMSWLRTAAFSLSLPGGLQLESPRLGGLSGLVCEMVQRGAGSYSSRDLVAVQDNLGMERNSGVTTAMVSFGAAMPAESISKAIPLYADVVRRPHLPSDQLEDARMMSMQELRAIKDEPTHRVMRRLRELFYGPQLGRSVYGTAEGLEAITVDDVRDFYSENYHAGGGILAIAGNVDPDEMIALADEAFGDWKSGDQARLPVPSKGDAYEHLSSPSSQTHIGFAFDSVPYGHPDYFKMRAAIGVLSDGMSSRLFDRVREKRGLCYTVAAGCHSLKHAGGAFGYAGTSPERAQETLDVTLREIDRLAEDLEASELDRWKVRIESSLIMEQESSASRASSLASDFYQLDRAMKTDELEAAIESLTVEQVREYWASLSPRRYQFVTLGPSKLDVPEVAAPSTS